MRLAVSCLCNRAPKNLTDLLLSCQHEAITSFRPLKKKRKRKPNPPAFIGWLLWLRDRQVLFRVLENKGHAFLALGGKKRDREFGPGHCCIRDFWHMPGSPFAGEETTVSQACTCCSSDLCRPLLFSKHINKSFFPIVGMPDLCTHNLNAESVVCCALKLDL